MSGKLIYRIENLSFSYDLKGIINNMSIDIYSNNILLILGPNGIGKSTFIKILAGILRPQSGNIILFNREMQRYSHRELSKVISYIPQSFFINFNYDVYSVIETGRYPHMSSLFSSLSTEDKEIIDYSLSMWDLNYIKNRSILELSGGERQRTIIASAMVQSSRILLFDEPTSNLDMKHIALFINNIKELKKEYDLIIIVTHDINLASILADDILYLKKDTFYSMDKKEILLDQKYLEDVFETNIRHEKGLFYIDER